MFRRHAADSHVGALVIMGPEPSGSVILDFVQTIEQVVRQPVIPDCTVVPFDIGILLRLTGLDEFDLNAALAWPSHKSTADLFRTVVAPNFVGAPSPFHDAF